MDQPFAANTADITRSGGLASTRGDMLHNHHIHDHASAVSWAAIFAGAAAAAALSLILLMLGIGLGLSSVSPWARNGASAMALGLSGIVWITFTQLVASAMGGYLAGRLRTRWLSVHGDEVHFRDTAHGFLAWSIASLATAALLTSTIGSIVGAGVQVAAPAVGAAATAAGVAGSALATAKPATEDAQMGYFVDSLFRKETGNTATGTAISGTASTSTAGAPAAGAEVGLPVPVAVSAAEAGRIFVTNLPQPALAPDDMRYVGQMVAQRTGLSQADSEKRVTDTYSRLQAKLQEAKAAALQTADQARKAAAKGSLWLFISLLAGAFVASLAATWGGRHRDL